MRRFRLLVPAAAAAVLVAAILALSGSHKADPPGRIEVQPLPRYVVAERTVVAPGDTVESLCRRLAGEDWVAWRDALLRVIDARSLRPGMVLVGRSRADAGLEELQLTIDGRTEVRAQRRGDRIATERLTRPLEHEVARVVVGIESSLFGALEAAGERPELAVRLAEIFQWDIDFFRDLRKGDRFVVIVDRESVDGSFYNYGTIYAARYVNGRRTLNAVVFPDAKGRLGYYNLKGQPLRKEFLRAPLKFSRITSRFSMHRFHPILKRWLPHYGVDYGAPVGTPVHVTADGVVRFVGRKRGAGKMISVRHTNGYETNYLHLSRYARGIRRGVRVRQGQLIGYVGRTGMATGPHLDYRVRHLGRWINPLRIASPPVKPIPPNRLKRYVAYAQSVETLLDGREPPLGASG